MNLPHQVLEKAATQMKYSNIYNCKSRQMDFFNINPRDLKHCYKHHLISKYRQYKEVHLEELQFSPQLKASKSLDSVKLGVFFFFLECLEILL